MKRFIDVGKQIGPLCEDDPENDWPRQFAFFCTVANQFEVHGEWGAWESWDGFARDYEGGELERYRRLCPDWVFGNAGGTSD